MLSGLSPPSLFEYAVKKELTQHIAVLASDGDCAGLGWMFELSVVTVCPVEIQPSAFSILMISIVL